MSKKRTHEVEDEYDEDDYMSDGFLAAAAQAVAPKLLNPRRREPPPPPSSSVISNKKAHNAVENEQRELGLSTAITSDNKGFQLLKKMGYKEGSKLGINQTNGLTEPIPIKIHPSRSGLGEQNEKKEKLRVKEEIQAKFNQQIQSTYQDNLKQKYYFKRLRVDITKCQSICERLDREKFNLEQNSLWKNSKQNTTHDDDDDDDDDDQQNCQNQWTMEDQLKELTEYLRNKHFYCIWCGQAFDTLEELENICPGNERDLH